jgi:hypothetical protein
MAATIQIEPVSSTILGSNLVDLNVNVTDVTDLYAYQFDIAFDPFTVSAISVTEGSFLAGGGATLFVAGVIEFGAIRFTANTLLGPAPGVSGSGTLATIQFRGASVGISPITPENIILLDSASGDIPADVQSGSITVAGTGIPEPNSGLLLGSALSLGLLGRCRLVRHRLLIRRINSRRAAMRPLRGTAPPTN